MATTVVSSQITAHGYTLASYLTYEVTTNNATTYTISVKGGIRIYTARLHMSSSTATSAVSGTGQTTASATESVYNPTASTYDQEYVSTSYSWTKGAAANKTISNKISFSSSSYFSGQTATASATITVPAKTYTVSYNANGGSGAPASQTKTHGVTLTLSSTKPTRTGYTFKGWATSSSSTTVAYAAGASYTGNANLSLYAVWQINTWQVTYNANGGSGSIANQTKTYNQALTLSNGAGFTRSLYNLVGWATSSGGAKAYNLGGSYTGNAALNLYAVWELAYVKPIINNFTCYRVATSGSTTETDDGGVIYISFDYVGGEVGGSTVNPTVVITIGGTTVYNTAQTSGTGTIAQWFDNGGNEYDKDSAFAVTVKVYDSNYPTGTTKTATIQTAIYLIDALASGTNVYAGIMHKAVSGKKLTLPETNVDGDLTVSGALSVSGSLTVGGTLTVGGHSSVVGTVETASDTTGHNVSSSTSFASITNGAILALTAGTWVITVMADYASNATGYRGVRIYIGTTTFSASEVVVRAVSGANTKVLTTTVVQLTTDRTVYVQALQNSGSALSTKSYIRAARIA